MTEEEGDNEVREGAPSSYEMWVRKKELLQRGLELFHQLDPSRAEEEESWLKVAGALRAIESYYLQIIPPNAMGTESSHVAEPKDEVGEEQDSSEQPRRRSVRYDPSSKNIKKLGPASLFEAFRKWSVEHHTFYKVQVTAQEVGRFSLGARDLFVKDKQPSAPKEGAGEDRLQVPFDQAPSGDENGNPNSEKLAEERWLLPSLTYATPKKPENKDEKIRPLTADQKLQNAIYLKVLKGRWEMARIAMEKEIAKVMGEEGSGGEEGNEEKGVVGGEGAIEEKGIGETKGEATDAKGGNDNGSVTSPAAAKDERGAGNTQRNGDSPNQYEQETKIRGIKKPPTNRLAELYKLGLPLFVEWIEEDQDRAIVQERESDAKREEIAKKAHATFLDRKKEARIRLPASCADLKGPGPRMDFSKGKPLIRPKSTGTFTTTEWRPAEKVKEIGEKKRAANEKAFKEWSKTKTLSEQAVRYLEAVEVPTAPTIVENEVMKAEEHWMEVGRALKAIDVTLFKNWMDWSKGYKPATFSACAALWDAFEPKACDIHCKISTSVKDTFLKLLKPGRNYKCAFEQYVERLWKRKVDAEDLWFGQDSEREQQERKEFSQGLMLNKREMRRFLADLGVVMPDDEVRLLIDAFDKNGDGVVSLGEFLEFVGEEERGSLKSETLQQRCVYNTTCFKCGMLNAYTVSFLGGRRAGWRGSNAHNDDNGESSKRRESKQIAPVVVAHRLKTGEERRRIEMVEHAKRQEVLRHFHLPEAHGDEAHSEEEKHDYGDDPDFEEENRMAKTYDHGPCLASTWTIEHRNAGMETLSKLSQENRDAQVLQRVLAKGSPPPAPRLTAAKLGSSEVVNSPTALTTDMLLLWRPAPGSLVAFVALEQQVTIKRSQTVMTSSSQLSVSNDSPVTQGRRSAAVQFREIARDPPDAEEDPKYQVWIEGLQPNTTYTFRMRGFNGFGAGAWVHASFTTRPLPPPAPVGVRKTPTSIVLRWKQSSDSYQQRLQQLKKIFEAADQDGDKCMSREELLAILQSKETQLLEFLRKVNVGPGVSVFDAIETDDNEKLSWEEFHGFFEDRDGLEGDDNDDNRSKASVASSVRSEQTVTPSNKTRYVVERCKSHLEESFKEVYRCFTNEATILDLRPGTTYRFRVYALNCDEEGSDYSPSAIVNTALETPCAPKLAPSRTPGVPTSLKLVWDQSTRTGGGLLPSEKLKGTLDKMLADWTKTASQSSAGVNVKTVFDTYDKNKDGTIEVGELDQLLQEMGVPPTEEKIREALSTFDENEDGKISFDEFNKWWHREEINYVLKRTEGLPASMYTTSNLVSAQYKVVCYKGLKTSCDVGGLMPNTYYQFRLRLTNAHASSALSPALCTMTPPKATEAPILVRIEPKSAILRWYPAEHGAQKYILQQRFVECLDAVAVDRNTNPSNNNVMKARLFIGDEEDWVVIYEGHDTMANVTGLALNSVYCFRLQATNHFDARSEFSGRTQVSTLPKETKIFLKPTTASECFTTDCTGDVVGGDTILFTERLYRSEDGKLIESQKVVGASAGFASPGGFTTPRLRMSAFSVESPLASCRSADLGEFIGERTVAAHVLKVSTAACKATANATMLLNSPGPRTFERSAGFPVVAGAGGSITKSRHSFRMEVIWSTVSNKDIEQYLLSKGDIIERSERKVFQFETFRMPWEHEKRRRNSNEEAVLMSL